MPPEKPPISRPRKPPITDRHPRPSIVALGGIGPTAAAFTFAPPVLPSQFTDPGGLEADREERRRVEAAGLRSGEHAKRNSRILDTSSSEEEPEQIEQPFGVDSSAGEGSKGVLSKAVSKMVTSISPKKSPKALPSPSKRSSVQNPSPRRRTSIPSPAKTIKASEITPKANLSTLRRSPIAPTNRLLSRAGLGDSSNSLGLNLGDRTESDSDNQYNDDRRPKNKGKAGSSGDNLLGDSNKESGSSIGNGLFGDQDSMDDLISYMDETSKPQQGYEPSIISDYPFPKSTQRINPFLPQSSSKTHGLAPQSSEESIPLPPPQRHIDDIFPSVDFKGLTNDALSSMLVDKLEYVKKLVQNYKEELRNVEEKKKSYIEATRAATNETDRSKRHGEGLQRVMTNISKTYETFLTNQKKLMENQQILEDYQKKLDNTQSAYIDTHLLAARQVNQARDAFVSGYNQGLAKIEQKYKDDYKSFKSDLATQATSLASELATQKSTLTSDLNTHQSSLTSELTAGRKEIKKRFEEELTELIDYSHEVQQRAKVEIDLEWWNAQQTLNAGLENEIAMRDQIVEFNEYLQQNQQYLQKRQDELAEKLTQIDRDYNYEYRRFPVLRREYDLLDDQSKKLNRKQSSLIENINSTSNDINVTSAATDLLDERFKSLAIQTSLNQNSARRTETNLHKFRSAIKKQLIKFGKGKASAKKADQQLLESEGRILDRVNHKLNSWKFKTDRAELGRVNAERSRSFGEHGRNKDESSRKDEEGTRSTRETQRINSETQRAANETQRAANDGRRERVLDALKGHERVMEEGERVRKRFEEGRQSAERDRVWREAKREDAETKRVFAELEREEAGNEHELDEQDREFAEMRRESNEYLRKEGEKGRIVKNIGRQTLETKLALQSTLGPIADANRQARILAEYVHTPAAKELFEGLVNKALRERTNDNDGIQAQMVTLIEAINQVTLCMGIQQSIEPTQPTVSHEHSSNLTTADRDSIPTVGTAVTRSLRIFPPIIPIRTSPVPANTQLFTPSPERPAQTLTASPGQSASPGQLPLDDYQFTLEYGMDGSPAQSQFQEPESASLRSPTPSVLPPTPLDNASSSTTQPQSQNDEGPLSATPQPQSQYDTAATTQTQSLGQASSTAAPSSFVSDQVFCFQQKALGLSFVQFKASILTKHDFWPSPAAISAAEVHGTFVSAKLEDSPYKNLELIRKAWFRILAAMEEATEAQGFFDADTYDIGLSNIFVGEKQADKVWMRYGAYLFVINELGAADITQPYVHSTFIEKLKSAFTFRDTNCSRDVKTFYIEQAKKEALEKEGGKGGSKRRKDRS